MERAQQARSPWGRWPARRAHLTQVGGRRHGFTSLSPLFSLVLLLTLLAAFAGCGMPMMPADILEDSRDIFPVGLFAVAIVFILLAAGVEIKILALGRFRPPDNRAGRILLAVLGVSMLSFLAGHAWLALLNNRDNPSIPSIDSEFVEPPFDESSSSVPVSGDVSFDNDGTRTAFKERYSKKLTIHAAGTDAEGTAIKLEATVDLDGQFAFDVPVSTRAQMKVTWSADDLGDYVLWPIEIKVPAWQAINRTDISFVFEKIDEFYHRHKDAAIEAVRACNFERADDVLTALLPVLERFIDQNPNSQKPTWPHDIHRDLANKADRVAKSQDCAQDRSTFERKWRRGAIERATTPEGRIYAMNAWATYSREVYRPSEMAWPDRTLLTVDLDEKEYRDFVRADMQLVMEKLDRARVRELVSNAIDPPAITGCLNDGQQDALHLFKSTLSTKIEEVNLNRMMNAISGLQRILLIGTWIDYPAPSMGKIEIGREQGGDGYRYRFSPHNSNEEPGSGELTFAPERFAPCRFETVVDTPGRRFVYVILEGPGQDGHLRMEPSGQVFRPAG